MCLILMDICVIFKKCRRHTPSFPLASLFTSLVRARPGVQIPPAAPQCAWHKKCISTFMNKLLLAIFLLSIASCSNNNLENDINGLFSEDYYLGTPGSKLFYRTTTKKTQEKYHYSECQKKILNGDQLRIESCVSSYWLKAKSL